MENRRPIHYRRNSVIVPKLGKKSMHSMVKKPRDKVVGPENRRPQDTSPKICSTLECPRCRAEQKYYRASCYRCGACFYCGLVGGGAFQCQLCGNHIPKEDRERPPEKTIRIL